MTGLPCSGKTYRTRQILAELEAHIASNPAFSRRTVQIIKSHHSSSDQAYESTTPSDPTPSLRDDIYNSAAQEKTARAEEFSAIKRGLSKDNIVIADGLNYIKGYRYQLWCEAKAAATRCCVVHVAAQEEECKQWNRERLRAWGRDDDRGGSDEGTGVPSSTKQAPGAQGTHVLGHLAPESHTAVYGDRVVGTISRSRSSSLDRVGGDGPLDNRNAGAAAADDSMTLKSLYIGDKTPDSPGRRTPQASHDTETPAETTTTAAAAPNVPIPPPTSAPPYSPSTLNSLMMRYEPPSPFSRWDTPLFVVPTSDAAPPTTQIWTALYPAAAKATSKKALAQSSNTSNTSTSSAPTAGANPHNDSTSTTTTSVKPHAATVLPQATGADALQILEGATMEVVRAVLEAARASGVTSATSATGSGSGSGEAATLSFSVAMPSPHPAVDASLYVPASVAPVLSQPLLQRLRRKYTQIQRGGIAHGQGYVSGRAAVVTGFVEFLDNEWNAAD